MGCHSESKIGGVMMKSMKWKQWSRPLPAAVIIILFVILPVYFQNCAEVAAPSTQFSMDPNFYETQISSLGTTHLPEIQLKNTYQKVLVVNRIYMQELFLDIFKNDKYPYPTESGSTITFLDRVVYENITRKGTFLGGPCDPNDSYTTQNCNGGVADASLPSFVDSNTVRASYVIQVCEQLLSAPNPAYSHLNQGVLAVLDKIGAVEQEPTDNNLRLLYQLFFRHENPSNEYLRSLKELNEDLKTEKEPLLARWKSLALMVCESPGWQIL